MTLSLLFQSTEDFSDEAILGVYGRADTTRITTNRQKEKPPFHQTVQSEHLAIKNQRTIQSENSANTNGVSVESRKRQSTVRVGRFSRITRNGKTESSGIASRQPRKFARTKVQVKTAINLRQQNKAVSLSAQKTT